MPRKGENIYKRKDGRWEGRYIKSRDIRNKAVYGYVYAGTYAEVKEKLSKYKSGYMKKSNSGSMEKIFQNFSDAWLRGIETQVKMSTYVKYKNILDKHLNCAIGGYPLSKVNTDLVRMLVEEKLRCGNLKTGEPLSSKTVRDILSVLKLVLNYARRSDAEVKCNIDDIIIKSTKRKPKILTAAEQKKLTEYLLKNINHTNLGILLSMYTGLRIGELCALRFSDISLENKILRVNSTMQRLQNFSQSDDKKTDIVIVPPKSEMSQRDIPLPEFLVELIGHFNCHENAFFLTGEIDKYIEPRCMENKFKKCLSKCGIEEITFHQLRHRFATNCVELGFEIKCLSEILGHSSVNITLNRYVHASLDMKKTYMAKLQEQLLI